MKKIKIFIGAFIAFLVVSCVQAQAVDVNTFEKGLQSNKDVQLLDVRTEAEFKTGTIKNAMWADWYAKDEFKRRMEALDKNKPVYVYCLSGGRSSAAAKYLKENGFKEVVDLNGGIAAWKQSGKTVTDENKMEQIKEEDYNKMLYSSKVVLVDFGAAWCAPCRKMEPVVQEIVKENATKMVLIKIDGGSQDELMKRKNVTQLPTFVIYKEGKETWRHSGLITKEELTKHLF